MHAWSDLSPGDAVMTDTELTFIDNAIANSMLSIATAIVRSFTEPGTVTVAAYGYPG